MPQDAGEAAASHARDADRKLDEAERKLAFASEVDAVTRRVADLAGLGTELARARTRGWSWGADWESTLAELQRGSTEVAKAVRTESSAATSRLQGRVSACRSNLSRTSVSASHAGTLHEIEEEADSIGSALRADSDRIEALARPFVQAHDRLQGEVTSAHTHLDRFEAAKFRMTPEEHPWLTADAVWQDGPGGAKTGLLYLTDLRIRFEWKEKVATKKFLFVTTASEEKHELLLDEPIGNVARSDDSTKGMIFKDQLITLGWQGAKWSKTTFDLNSGGTAKEWDTWIEEARSGQLAHRRSGSAAPARVPIDPPTVCSACAAVLDAPVRGMATLACKYCGQLHNLRFA